MRLGLMILQGPFQSLIFRDPVRKRRRRRRMKEEEGGCCRIRGLGVLHCGGTGGVCGIASLLCLLQGGEISGK